MNIKNRSEFICGKLLSFFLVPIVMVTIFPTEMFSEKRVTKVAVGANHTLILKQDSNGNPGTLWAMGDNQYGQLGDGTTTDRSLAVEVKVGEVAVTGVTDIAAGDNHSFYIKSDGSLWAMGLNTSGQLGKGDILSPQNTPVQIQTTGVSKVAAGSNHSLILKSDGSLWAMGDNQYGQLGNGNTTNQTSPVQILASGVTDIAAGSNHTLFLKSNGSLWVMGNNQYGQLGNGTDGVGEFLVSPFELEANAVTKIAAGANHSLYVKNNYLWAIGRNSAGQLGDSTVWDRNRPIIVPGIEGSITDVISGANHSFYIQQNGNISAMGSNEDGQLGIGSSYKGKDLNVSVEIPNSNGSSIFTGQSHTFLLKADGNLFASGKNTKGQLGIGNETIQDDFSNAKVKAYVVTVSEPSKGNYTKSPNNTHYAFDANITITATANTGYKFEEWKWGDDKKSDLAKYSFNIKQDITFTPKFAEDDGDDDNDSLTNFIESSDINLDPNKPDTDGDGFTDFEEYNNTEILTLGKDDSTIMNFITNRLDASYYRQNDLNDKYNEGYEQGVKDENQRVVQDVEKNPSEYGVFDQKDLDAKYSKGFTDGNDSGVAYVQANPGKFNFLTDAEKNASYDLGYTAGHTAGLAEAEAAGLGEAQAKLALENLSSLTYLDEIRALKKSKPHTDGWYFQPGLGWLWTNRDTFPFLYRQAEDGVTEGWLYFSQLPEQIKKPYYDYNAEKWISSSGN